VKSNSSSRRDVERLRKLRVAVVADVLDRLGHRNQVMSARMRPLLPDAELLAGPVHTIRAEVISEIKDNPYEVEIAAVDAVPSEAVIVMESGGSDDVGCWGELLCTRARHRGATGVVIDGGVRDLQGLRRIGMPTFATAVSANDSRGRLEAAGWGVPIHCAGVDVGPDDLVLGDPDGVVIVPHAAIAATLDAAEEKTHMEQVAHELLDAGMSVAEVWKRHRVL
jgi:4-hydroxy-4-methyl-2-oxoglutarate aldolase